MKIPPFIRGAAVCLAVVAVSVVLCERPLPAAEPLTFEKDVRPIFKAHCFHCHGEDGKREGGLDLQWRRRIVVGGESGPAIEPGDPNASYLLDRVRLGEMPPGEKKLSAAEVASIERWIAEGAITARPEPEAPDAASQFTAEELGFWSFQPIRRPPLPAVQAADRVQTPIDAFILARLEADGLSLSPPADRVTLVRRLYFDLLGLPPTPEAIDAALADPGPDALERLVDRLLASPHYGERWGRQWLDVAGYADSEGYTDADPVRVGAFRYRDYVIRSFNADLSFDQFIREQLAGDELVPPPHQNLTPEQIDKLTATGFLRMAPDGTGGGGVDQEVARNDVIADTIQIATSSLLGLTVACARCHNHRYDPISQVDYYRLRAIFEPALDWKQWRPPQARLVSLYTDADRAVAAKIQTEAAAVDAEREQKVREFIDRTLEEELAMLPEAGREPLRVAYKTPAGERTAEQQRLLEENPSVGNISAGSLYLYDQRRDQRARKIEAALPAKEKQLVEDTRRRELEKVPEEEREAVRIAAETAAAARSPEQQALLQKFPAVEVTAATLAQFNPEAAAELERDRQAAAMLRAEKSVEVLKRFTDRAAEIRATIPPEGFVRALTEPLGHAPATMLFIRGDHQQPKQAVAPGELSVLAIAGGGNATIPEKNPQLPTTGRRLAYAEHLTSGSHPLVARVIVNRIWLGHFGRGLVNSPGDFGALGERPTHPELLDWLADEFVSGGWSVKQLHKLIVLSATYQQSSRRNESLDRLDPDNRLLGRASLRRLDAESVRDSVLAASGMLVEKMFGEPVPVMEDEVGQIVIGIENLDGERKPTDAVSLHGEEFRRSLYVQVRRSRPLAVLETFDTPAMTPNCVQRNASNVAPQSLLLMNSEFTIDFARRLADRALAESSGDPRQAILRAWRLVLGHPPTPAELAAAETFVQQQTAAFEKQPSPPTGSPTAASPPRSPSMSALASLCQALLSTNRFLYLD